MRIGQAKQLKELEKENTRLKKLVAEHYGQDYLRSKLELLSIAVRI